MASGTASGAPACFPSRANTGLVEIDAWLYFELKLLTIATTATIATAGMAYT
jgi:hypothetical protein